MTPEQQRIAIAEACGWTEISDWGAGGINGKHPTEPWVEVIPDYLNDLNAMHEAEGTLNKESGYHETGGYGLYLVALDHDVSATAAQRAEAFLRTIGKWVDQ
jgi:hypothetical protein